MALIIVLTSLIYIKNNWFWFINIHSDISFPTTIIYLYIINKNKCKDSVINSRYRCILSSR